MVRGRGWRRLWVFVGVLYAVVVAAVAVRTWPLSESGIRAYTVLENDTGEQFSFEFHGPREPNDAEIEEIVVQLKAGPTPPVGAVLSSDPAWGTSGALVIRAAVDGRSWAYFPGGTTQPTVDRAISLKVNGPWPERYWHIGTAALWWAVPMAFLYLLGWGIGWVFRGFQQA